MHDIVCDGQGGHRLRKIFSNWRVYCRECKEGRERGYSILEPNDMAFTLSWDKTGEVTFTGARIGEHAATVTPDLERRLIEAGKEALGIRRRVLSEIRMGLAQAAPTRK